MRGQRAGRLRQVGKSRSRKTNRNEDAEEAVDSHDETEGEVGGTRRSIVKLRALRPVLEV